MRKPAACSAKLLLLPLLIVTFAVSAAAQNNKGAIVGTVKDPNDALVSKAQVKVTSAKTGEIRTTDTGDDGTYTVTNLEPGTTRYLVDPAEHVALLKRLRGGPRDVIGAYHSHPRSPAWPSPSDIADAFSAHFVYVIVSLADPATPAVRAFRIGGSEVIELTIAGQP